jgi:hypothetical protein
VSGLLADNEPVVIDRALSSTRQQALPWSVDAADQAPVSKTNESVGASLKRQLGPS